MSEPGKQTKDDVLKFMQKRTKDMMTLMGEKLEFKCPYDHKDCTLAPDCDGWRIALLLRQAHAEVSALQDKYNAM